MVSLGQGGGRALIQPIGLPQSRKFFPGQQVLQQRKSIRAHDPRKQVRISLALYTNADGPTEACWDRQAAKGLPENQQDGQAELPPVFFEINFQGSSRLLFVAFGKRKAGGKPLNSLPSACDHVLWRPLRSLTVTALII